MADKKESKPEQSDPGIRYRYIGFEVFPKEKKPFFTSEEEKKRYVTHLEDKKKEEEREFSLLFVSSFHRVEKTILFIAALALVASPALAWFFLPTPRGNELFLGFNLFLALAAQLGTVFAANPLAGAGAVLILLNLALAPLGGILLFGALLGKGANPVNPYGRTKKLLGLHFVPVIFYLLIFGLSCAGLTVPGSPLPVFREGFNIFELLSDAGWGFWAVFVAHLLAAVKSADL